MNTVIQLKAHISNLSRKTGVKPEVLYRNYMTERFLKRLSLAQYKSHIVLKGGLLIAYMVGFESRATMDLDGTIRGYPVTEENLKAMLNDIISIPADDNISFKLNTMNPIMLDTDYECLRVNMTAVFEKLKISLKLDISTGDAITPHPIEFYHKLMFGEGQIEIFAYNLETILAEKIETVIRRNIANSRMRDYYDIYILMKLKEQNINFELLKSALQATSKNRDSTSVIKNTFVIFEDIKINVQLQNLWESYCADYEYAKDIKWNNVCASIHEILLKLELI